MSVPDLDGADFEPDLPALGDVFANNCPTIGAGDGGRRGDCGRGCGGVGRFGFGHYALTPNSEMVNIQVKSCRVRNSSTQAA